MQTSPSNLIYPLFTFRVCLLCKLSCVMLSCNLALQKANLNLTKTKVNKMAFTFSIKIFHLIPFPLSCLFQMCGHKKISQNFQYSAKLLLESKSKSGTSIFRVVYILYDMEKRSRPIFLLSSSPSTKHTKIHTRQKVKSVNKKQKIDRDRHVCRRIVL